MTASRTSSSHATDERRPAGTVLRLGGEIERDLPRIGARVGDHDELRRSRRTVDPDPALTGDDPLRRVDVRVARARR